MKKNWFWVLKNVKVKIRSYLLLLHLSLMISPYYGLLFLPHASCLALRFFLAA